MEYIHYIGLPLLVVYDDKKQMQGIDKNPIKPSSAIGIEQICITLHHHNISFKEYNHLSDLSLYQRAIVL